MYKNHKSQYFFTILCGHLLFCSLATVAPAAAAEEKRIVINAQKKEQCPCCKCYSKWFPFLRSGEQHPHTEQEKTLAYLCAALPCGNFANGQLSPLAQLVLDYAYAADSESGYEYEKETWLKMESIQGTFHDVAFPYLERYVQLGDEPGYYRFKAKLFFPESVSFDPEELEKVRKVLRNALQYSEFYGSLSSHGVAVSTCGNYEIVASKSFNPESWKDESLITSVFCLNHTQRIQQLVLEEANKKELSRSCVIS